MSQTAGLQLEPVASRLLVFVGLAAYVVGDYRFHAAI